MIGRWFSWPTRIALLLLIGTAFALAFAASAAMAQQICAVDLHGNGAADDPGETASCVGTASGNWLCPIEATPCTAEADGSHSCPLGTQYACQTPASGGTPLCSANTCIDTSANPIEDDEMVDDPGAPADGAVDADGNCLGNIEIFSGRAVRCRPAGLKTTFQNCCKDRGKVVKDGMGSSAASMQTKIRARYRSAPTGLPRFPAKLARRPWRQIPPCSRARPARRGAA